MAESAEPRYAVVTGANRGIGLGICEQLAAKGIVVVLTARDEKKGLEALENLKAKGFSSEKVLFHKLDVADSSSVATLAHFINSQFGKLDILVNNAGICGIHVDFVAFDSNASESVGLIPDGRIKEILALDANNLTDEKIDEAIDEFLEDVEEVSLKSKGWTAFLPAYTISKAAVNAYTRIVAKRYPKIIVNSVCPGYVKTYINYNTGTLSVEEGAASPVKLALLPDDGPSGLFFFRGEVSDF